MDSIVSSAMEAICSRGPGGIAVEDLWPRLDDPIASAGLDLCEGVKAAIWGRLIGVPGLRFHGRDGRVLAPGNPSVRSVEGAGVLRIIADEHLRDSFLGIYDLKASDAEISAIQRRTLERLAIAGTDGITQSELAKEFNVKGNSIFYFLRQLECKQLITRQSTIIRTKEVGAEGDNDTRNSSIVNTNLLHLHRYSKHLNLNSQQRLEIIRPDASENNDNAGESPLTGGCDSGYCAKEEVLVKDYLPAMKAVCDKLEEAGKKICNRLKEARLVEEFSAEVDKKVVRCLRLLKSFDPKDFQPKALVRGSDEIDAEQLIKRGKRGQIYDQLVELPIEHQIYDLIDAEGHKGLTYSEVCSTALGALREQRILERLQEQKFVLVAELCKWLEGLEKDTTTKMAKKTLTHMLEKLKQQQLCKCVQVSVPVVTNCGRSRTTVVVLHPSVGSLSSELLAQIHERLRNFDAQGRQGLARSVNHPVSVLTDVKRPVNHHRVLDSQIVTEAMRANGFVPAKMIRAKLLHIFLWDYLNNLPDWHDALSSGKHSYDPKNPNSTCKLFSLDDSVNAMPLELFLQVVGYAQQSEFLVENCRSRLTLGELPSQEYRRLMDAQAKGRLALVVRVLRRLKLIQLVTGGDEGETNLVSHAVLADAMELKPCIEEPVSRGLPSSIISSFDLRPRIRHDFILSNRDAVDAYWKTLEYCYAAADPTTASHAFPGSSVLLKRMENYDSKKKISFEQCVKISRDLNLTLEQVLRVSHDKKRSRLRRQLVIQYAKYRAVLGAKFHRVDWASLADLPAPPDTCRRRMAASSRRLPEKFLKFLDGRGISPNEQVRKSPVAATAVELLKLVFLNTSTAPEVPRLLAETLQRFSECELLVAFNYLREKNFMVIGQGSHPFVLSQKFWQSASSSPFPVDTGKRATSFSSWLQKQEQYLQEDGVSLYADLHCGDIFHLFALLSSEEFSISPCMPLDGIGETEEQVTLKRKICREKNGYENEFKRPKTLCFREGDCPRREKGFPGLKVSLNREKISRPGTVKLSKDDDDSIWDAMVKYAETTALRLGQKQVSHLQPDLFKYVYAAINQAGEQGLSVEQIPQVMTIRGENLAETVIDALQVFGLIVKVNAFDCVHAIAAHHKSKYFLYSVSGHLRDRPILPWINGDGSMDTIMYKGLTRRIVGTVMQNPGISEVCLLSLSFPSD
ncbi:hypothetical protein QJS04_geneDACA010700 [Acorus gramineus]|uniref:B-block binding subunit of TFIIIC domain-containing protein n=1 Tax=Acorus gramineus TaxID=55184 RepID=A0AAV9AML9_ACOGR|nr:hypothetical protein QJS04_geneDACA010700 [Acorus gramineus]